MLVPPYWARKQTGRGNIPRPVHEGIIDYAPPRLLREDDILVEIVCVGAVDELKPQLSDDHEVLSIGGLRQFLDVRHPIVGEDAKAVLPVVAHTQELGSE